MTGRPKLEVKVEPRWVCPKCGRGFVSAKVAHRCVREPPGEHPVGWKPELRAAYDRLLAEARRNGLVSVRRENRRFILEGKGRFGEMSLHKGRVLCRLFVEHGRRRIHTTHRVDKRGSRRRFEYSYVFMLDGPDDVNADVIFILRQAYAVARMREADLLPNAKLAKR